jgi:eukaryotic translation initiation factor 2C
LVSSVDREFSQYVASVRVQEARVEMIEDMADMFEVCSILHLILATCREIRPPQKALEAFKQKNNDMLPARILVFRDGVSEGEFLTVRNVECAAMQGWEYVLFYLMFLQFILFPGPLQKLYGPPTKWPSMAFIIVGKRHHFRFFPADRNSEDEKGNGNLQAGFVVDTGEPEDMIRNTSPLSLTSRYQTPGLFGLLSSVSTRAQRKYVGTHLSTSSSPDF